MPNNLVFNNSADQLKTSIYGSDGTTLKPIAVNSSGSMSITATDLDIRNLASGKDTVDIGNTVTVEATDFDIRNLAAGQDTVDIGTITGTVTVQATDLDIRDLASGKDTVDIGNTVTVEATDFDIRNLAAGQDTVDVGTLGSITGTVTVQATDLDIRDLASGKDTVDIGNTITVQATDFDIRNLATGQDTVDIGTITGTVNSNVSSRTFVEDNINLGSLSNTTGTTLEEDISTFTTYSYFIRNIGTDTVQITVEGSPVLDDSYYTAIESDQAVSGGNSAIITTGKFIKYLRLRYTVATGETANVLAYFNGQV